MERRLPLVGEVRFAQAVIDVHRAEAADQLLQEVRFLESRVR